MNMDVMIKENKISMQNRYSFAKVKDGATFEKLK